METVVQKHQKILLLLAGNATNGSYGIDRDRKNYLKLKNIGINIGKTIAMYYEFKTIKSDAIAMTR